MHAAGGWVGGWAVWWVGGWMSGWAPRAGGWVGGRHGQVGGCHGCHVGGWMGATGATGGAGQGPCVAGTLCGRDSTKCAPPQPPLHLPCTVANGRTSPAPLQGVRAVRRRPAPQVERGLQHAGKLVQQNYIFERLVDRSSDSHPRALATRRRVHLAGECPLLSEPPCMHESPHDWRLALGLPQELP